MTLWGRRLALPLCLLTLLVGCKDKDKGKGEATPEPTAAAAAAEPTPAPSTPAAAVDDGCADLRDNKGLAACEAACAAGSAKACDFAGELHIEEDDESVSDANALPFLQKACDGGDGDGCRMVGVFYRGGLGGLAKDEAKMKEFYARALPLLETECDGGNRVSCNFAGGFYSSPEGDFIAADAAKALAMWKKGCELGSPGCCESVKKAEAAGGEPGQ